MNKVDLKMVLATLVLFVAACGMITGDIQNVITFEDPINEMVLTLMLFVGVIGCAMNVKK